MNYLKISKAEDLDNKKDRALYRIFEIIPGLLSWATLVILIALSYLRPTWVAYFIIVFDVYWLLLVVYLSIHLLVSYRKLKGNIKVDWEKKCKDLVQGEIIPSSIKSWEEIYHLIILPTYNEGLEVIRTSFNGLIKDNYPKEKIIIVLAIEERGGTEALARAKKIEKEYGNKFRKFLITIHPDGIVGEIKGKGSNQAWAAREVKKIIDLENFNYDKILVSVFDIDTVVEPGYFFCLAYKFLTTLNSYQVSFQPVPIYHNNIWQAPFFSRVAASSNTFWQMMQQIRTEKLATYSSHSMSWRALTQIDFWSTNMVSEDSRIFWHCFLYYHGDYRVEPMHFPVFMDVCMDDKFWRTVKNLYKQQRRWGWGVENIPYLLFNTLKHWRNLPKAKVISRILNQIYGFHSWATNALIIGVIGWLPLLLGGDRFNATVLSGNLPYITRLLMTFSMVGLVFSAIISTLLLPKRPSGYGFGKSLIMVLQWLILPVSIIFFGSFPALEAQTRLMFKKYLGFWVTPKRR